MCWQFELKQSSVSFRVLAVVLLLLLLFILNICLFIFIIHIGPSFVFLEGGFHNTQLERIYF